MKYQPEQYRAIAIWGQMLGSYGYYIKEQQARAAAEGAPLTAIFERMASDGSGRAGEWAIVEEVQNPDALARLVRGLAVHAAD